MFLTDRASILRAFFRLVNSTDDDPDATEHDETLLEGFYLLLQKGAEAAQRYLIDHCGMGSWWLTESAAITWTGTDPNRYTDLPANFLKAFGSKESSPFHSAEGRRWGVQIATEERWQARGNYWYFWASAGTRRIYLARGANPPSGLVLDYIRRIGTLQDATTVDCPEQERDLIPAYAALAATSEQWFPGDAATKQDIKENLARVKAESFGRGRATLDPRPVGRTETLGDHWLT